jgi:hypothetical protein
MNDAVTTPQLDLDDVITRLARHERVEGALLIGSRAGGNFSAASDYDLVIVLHQDEPLWYVGVTQIDGRFTDLIFVAATALDRLMALRTPLAAAHELAPIVRWLQTGQIVADPTGRLHEMQQRLGEETRLLPPNEEAAYGAWFAVNYNLAQARRMLPATDPIYQATLDIRIAVYGAQDLWFSYFTIRRLPWQGDKAAVRYLTEHDPHFLHCYQQFLAETERNHKLELYKTAAALVTAPLGGLWPDGATVINLEPAPIQWHALISGS